MRAIGRWGVNLEPAALRPVSFQRFFESSHDLAESPFLKARAARYLHHLDLKAALGSGVLLAVAASCHFLGALPQLFHIALTLIYFAAGTPALIASLRDLSKANFEIDILMTVAAFASAATGHSLEGALLLVLFALSRAIETAVTARARSSLSGLRHIAPKSAHVQGQDGQWVERHIADVQVKDLLLIKAGEIVPLDGQVHFGTSQVDVAHLTGESGKIAKGPGDPIASGSQNGDGALHVRVSSTSSDSTLFRLIELVTRAQAAKPRLQHVFERFESRYAQSIFICALLLAIVPPLVGLLTTADASYRAICFLIAASPCALILALPIAYLSAISSCAKRGIILKGGSAIEAFSRCRHIAFDKTGTLTADRLEIKRHQSWSLAEKQAQPLETKSISETFRNAIASAESNVVHPIASALVAWCGAENRVPPLTFEEFRAVPGQGVEATLAQSQHHLRVGQLDWALSTLPKQVRLDVSQLCARWKADGFVVTAAAMDEEIALFALKETLRDDVVDVLNTLRSMGFTLMMLTGDSWENARRVAADLDIQEVHAQLSPEEKLQRIRDFDRTAKLAMIGDGVNDAPALAAASVGIAMGKGGSALAVEAADIVLLEDRLDLLVWVARKAKATRRIVLQNLGLALVAIVIASIGSSLGWIPLAVAVCAHEGGTVLVGLNGLRLLKSSGTLRRR